MNDVISSLTRCLRAAGYHGTLTVDPAGDGFDCTYSEPGLRVTERLVDRPVRLNEGTDPDAVLRAAMVPLFRTIDAGRPA